MFEFMSLNQRPSEHETNLWKAVSWPGLGGMADQFRRRSPYKVLSDFAMVIDFQILCCSTLRLGERLSTLGDSSDVEVICRALPSLKYHTWI